MSINISNNERPLKPGLRAGIIKRVVQVILLILFQTVVLFLAAGSFDWDWAWAFVLLNVATVTLNMTILLNYHPETIAERAGTEGMKGWDKIVGGLWGLTYFVGLLLVAGLDWRFGWSGPLNLFWHWLGIVIFILGGALFSWAMIANAYFATVARVQEGQTICSSGPYQFVRHPGYAGAVIQSLGLPLLLGSLWALIPGGLAVLLMVARTALEDSTLQEELPGYEVYAQQVQYRLLPGVW